MPVLRARPADANNMDERENTDNTLQLQTIPCNITG